MNTNTNINTAVLPATGKTGSRVLAGLQAAGLPATGYSRRSEPAFDWDDPTTWEPVLRDVDQAFISFQPDTEVPGARETIVEFARTAKELGVERLVLVTGRGMDIAQLIEQDLLEILPKSTIVRCSWFVQNFTAEGGFSATIPAGFISLPAPGQVLEPFIDADDIAAVAVEALRTHRYDGEVLELTGPESISLDQMAAHVQDVQGSPVRYDGKTPDDFTALLTRVMPAEVAAELTAAFVPLFDGRNEKATDVVETVLGRPATSFKAAYERDAG